MSNPDSHASGRQMARALGLGRLKYHLWTRPNNALDSRLGAKYRGEMLALADTLPPLEFPPGEIESAPSLYFVTGQKLLALTVLCVYSLVKESGRPIRLVFFDDGSLSAENIKPVERVFPGLVSWHPVEETEARLDEILPTSRFPILRDRRLSYLQLRKLVDVFATGNDWRMVMDVDIFTLRRPERLLHFLEQGSGCTIMADRHMSYAVKLEEASRIAGYGVLPDLNAGIYSLDAGGIDWEQVESWYAEMRRDFRPSFFEEQTLVAMLVSSRGVEVLPREDYLCGPAREEVRNPTAVMHHYTGNSENRFYRFRVAERLCP